MYKINFISLDKPDLCVIVYNNYPMGLARAHF